MQDQAAEDKGNWKEVVEKFTEKEKKLLSENAQLKEDIQAVNTQLQKIKDNNQKSNDQIATENLKLSQEIRVSLLLVNKMSILRKNGC